MATSFAALIFRPEEISDRALCLGFAVSLGGFDVPRPRLLVAPLRGLDGWAVAFYSSGTKASDEDFEHACELFEEDLSPPLAILDVVGAPENHDPRVYWLLYSEDVGCDDAARVDSSGICRHFVREGDGGPEWGVETGEDGSVVELPADIDEDDSDAVERALRPHRGSSFLSSELGAPVLAAVMGALFADARAVPIHLVEPSAASIAEATEGLVRALKRTIGRGAFAPPALPGGKSAPAPYAAFVDAYDWTDPHDPKDLYRELSIGLIEGTLHFLRAAEIEALGAAPSFSLAREAGLYPVARLSGSSLHASHTRASVVAIGRDGEGLWLVFGEKAPVLAGPTFGELLAYLTLGWSQRSDAEEDRIEALMLKAHVRSRRDEHE